MAKYELLGLHTRYENLNKESHTLSSITHQFQWCIHGRH